MNSLAEALKRHHGQITSYLCIGYAGWDDLVTRVAGAGAKRAGDFADEQIWTFLLACGYAAAGRQGVLALTEALTGSRQTGPAHPRIWFEVLPIPPRESEGETHVDLALGTIVTRKGTESGVELDAAESPWVCFCEMKWYSDISAGVTYDTHRNQLARVIENAICFQRAGRYAETVFVTLVTPSIFHPELRRSKSRLYQYKFEEYETNRARLIDDLNECALKRRDQPGWTYPGDLPERVGRLSLRWATYDELFGGVPDSVIATDLKSFWETKGSYQGRSPAV